MKSDLRPYLLILLCFFFGLLLLNSALKMFNQEGMENKEENADDIIVAKTEKKVRKPLA